MAKSTAWENIATIEPSDYVATGSLAYSDAASYAENLGLYQHPLIKGGVGHFLPQEAPMAFAEAIIDTGNS
jgi:hypothetical protein